MELDEMKLAWQTLNRRLARSEALQGSLRRELSIDRTRVIVRRWLWLPGIELAISAMAAWLAGGFLGDHIGRIVSAPAGGLAALLALLLAIAGIVASVRQMVSVATIDYAMPVLEIQRDLATARMLRIRLTQLSLLLWLPLWPMFMLFIAQYVLGFDVYRQFDPAWLLINMAFGLFLALLLVWLSRRYGKVLARWRPLIALADSVAGAKLIAATAQLDEFARFERE